MKIEYLIDKDDYKSLLKKISLTASNGVTIEKKNLAYKGKTNYLLQLSSKDESDEGAIALCEIKERVDVAFSASNIDCRLLTNEASQYYGRKLFPLVSAYETKLRRFIQSVLFDIKDEAASYIIKRLKAANIINADADIKKANLLELSELGDVIDFLFSNDELAKEIKEFTSKNRNFTRDELTALITNSNKHTVWEDFFEKDFPDSLLPNTLVEIKNYRNDVMHFHEINYKKYRSAQKALSDGIKDLDKQIAKKNVIEDTQANIDRLTGRASTYRAVLSSLYPTTTALGRYLNEINSTFNPIGHPNLSLESYLNSIHVDLPIIPPIKINPLGNYSFSPDYLNTIAGIPNPTNAFAAHVLDLMGNPNPIKKSDDDMILTEAPPKLNNDKK